MAYKGINGLTREIWEEADQEMTRRLVRNIELDAAIERARKPVESLNQREAHLYQLWKKHGKPKQNKKIWEELKDFTMKAGEGANYDQCIITYEDGTKERLERKTFQNAMAKIRKQQ